MLQESEGKHRHERVTVKTLPRSSFEVVEAKLLFHLLMGLLTNPSCLDDSSQSAQIGRGRQIGEVVLILSRTSRLPTRRAEPANGLVNRISIQLQREVGQRAPCWAGEHKVFVFKLVDQVKIDEA